MDDFFEDACNKLTIDEAMEQASNSYIPFAHRLVTEIANLRKQLANGETGIALSSIGSQRSQPWIAHDH